MPHGKAPIAPDHGRAHRVPRRDDGPSGPKARQGVHRCQIARSDLRVADCEIASRELPRNGVSAANPPTSAPWGARPREGTLGFPTARKRLGANQRKEPSGSGPREELRSTRKRQGDHGCPSKGRRLRTPDRGRTPRGSESAQNPRVLDADELHWRMNAERTLGGRIAAGTFGCPPRKGVHGHPTARRNLRVPDRATTSTGVELRKGTFGLPTKERRFGSRPRDCVSGT